MVLKLKFKHQKFQAEAARAVCDVFNGQPRLTSSYLIDKGVSDSSQAMIFDYTDFTGYRNQPLVSELDDSVILENLQKVQRSSNLQPSSSLSGRFNLSVEMETGVGKTYTYIKTMYELNARYGWSKFIIVVPSVAIREGVAAAFKSTAKHFTEEYGKGILPFVYNSSRLHEIDTFASDSNINVMIINSQAFNARGKDARRIYMRLDDFRSRRPIDVIAKTNPILIIDEPQSVEGAVTKEKLKEFNALFTLRYSATFKPDQRYDMIYRLDAIDAYNKKLVKKIAVKGITLSGTTGTEGYLYFQKINRSDKNPTVTIEYDYKGGSGIRKMVKTVAEGFKLFEQSNELPAYRDGYTVMQIDGRDSSITLSNGKKLYEGDALGLNANDEQVRRIQIRETILSHLERERFLFHKGIKVLSLFFIDEVIKYRDYSAPNNNGAYAVVFEEEYKAALETFQMTIDHTDAYLAYLKGIAVADTHAGYFSIDKNKRFVDSELGDKKERTSDDSDAYDLIMKDKERLLDRKEPVRFIFSHSALREGWDNPNVFQICTLKKSGSDIRKRQEVGRGMRLCVNQDGERIDEGKIGAEVHNINILTVIASESYDTFARGLQIEIAEAVADRPRLVTADLFEGKIITDMRGEQKVIDRDLSLTIYEGMISSGYIKKGVLTDKYYADKKNDALDIADEVADSMPSVVAIIESVYDPNKNKPEDARKYDVELRLKREKLNSAAFQELWKRISKKSVYAVEFETDELVDKAIAALDSKLTVSRIRINVEYGIMKKSIKSKEELIEGSSFKKQGSDRELADIVVDSSVKYDLVGKIAAETELTRATVVMILQGIQKVTFDNFRHNPEEFILNAAKLINEQKATVIIKHITYQQLDDSYTDEIFTEPTLKGRLGVNAVETPERHLYDHVLYDSDTERNFVTELDIDSKVEVYVKLPRGFFIYTPVGKYNPDWAIVFHKGTVKHIYFVAETKGSMSSMQLKLIEEAKIDCARAHFKAISGAEVVYDVIDSFDTLMNKVMR